jgi:hypothetical protein
VVTAEAADHGRADVIDYVSTHHGTQVDDYNNDDAPLRVTIVDYNQSRSFKLFGNGSGRFFSFEEPITTDIFEFQNMFELLTNYRRNIIHVS